MTRIQDGCCGFAAICCPEVAAISHLLDLSLPKLVTTSLQNTSDTGKSKLAAIHIRRNVVNNNVNSLIKVGINHLLVLYNWASELELHRYGTSNVH